MCGGYHPDWCVELADRGRMHRVLVGFGCQEADLYGEDNDLRVDLDQEAYKRLRDVLTRYRTSRPEPVRRN